MSCGSDQEENLRREGKTEGRTLVNAANALSLSPKAREARQSRHDACQWGLAARISNRLANSRMAALTHSRW